MVGVSDTRVKRLQGELHRGGEQPSLSNIRLSKRNENARSDVEWTALSIEHSPVRKVKSSLLFRTFSALLRRGGLLRPPQLRVLCNGARQYVSPPRCVAVPGGERVTVDARRCFGVREVAPCLEPSFRRPRERCADDPGSTGAGSARREAQVVAGLGGECHLQLRPVHRRGVDRLCGCGGIHVR